MWMETTTENAVFGKLIRRDEMRTEPLTALGNIQIRVKSNLTASSSHLTDSIAI